MTNELIETMKEFSVEAWMLGAPGNPGPATHILVDMLTEIHRLRGELSRERDLALPENIWKAANDISVVCAQCKAQWFWSLTNGELVLNPAEVVCSACYGAWDVPDAAPSPQEAQP